MVAIPQASMMHKIIDPHVHFFDLAKGDYAWLLPENPPHWPDKSLINKNITPHHLQLGSDCSLQGAVHIEAGFDNNNPKREVDWLVSEVYPQAPNAQFRTIGFIDMFAHADAFEQQFLNMTNLETLAGFRFIFEDDSRSFDDKARIRKNLSYLVKGQLLFECQADFTKNILISDLLNLMVTLPELKLVINHAGLPPLAGSKAFVCWQENMKLFAELPNCYVKCSGFEMTSREYTKEHVCIVLSTIAELFGYERMMLASNFPLTLFTRSYALYWALMVACAESIGLPIKKVLYTNAKDLYRFS
ncbi:MAG: putative TIM-barrel fold metal-dependent hydrolase [Alphaproteobacteria bacterium]|jgi:predicted TIM-barrel fold metal-dependent hydrolase